MKTQILFALAITLGGCVSGTLSDTITVNKDLSFVPPVVGGFSPAICGTTNAPVFTTTQNTTFDMSDAVSQLQKQGTLTVSFTENSVSGDLSAFKHARVFINNDGLPPELLSETDFTPTNGKVNLPILLDNSVVVADLSSGKINLTVDLSSCVPASAVDVHYTMTANLSLAVSKP
jgi:hypothetical protein